MDATPEKTVTKKGKRTSTLTGKVRVATLKQTSSCHNSENPQDVAAAHVNDGEMDGGEVALPPQELERPQQLEGPQQLERPQQRLDETTYIMGGVICGKLYMVIMKFIQICH